MQRSRLIGPAVLLVAALAAAGCGTSGAAQNPPAAQAPADAASGVNIAVFRQQHFDYDAAKTPEELVRKRQHDVIVQGVVEGVEQGREIASGAGDEQPLLHVVLRVRVTDKLRAKSARQVQNGRVYVELWQGPRANDAAGAPAQSLASWRKAVPAGTPVMLFLTKATADPGVRHAARGLPAGAELLTPDVQGVIFQDRGKLLGGLEDLEAGWTQLTSLSQLNGRVKQALRK